MAEQVQVDAMASGYVYLKNISGTVIKPITDLSGINMTTTNGIAVVQTNGGTIGIRDGYIESCYYAEMVDPGVGPANVDSAFIEGGTMFTLIGGYTVTDEIPPAIDASHERIPSEYSVRSAIDALATLGPSFTPGAGIVVTTVPGSTGGILSVAEGDGIEVKTAQQGGVSVKAGDGLTVDSTGVYVNKGDGLSFDNGAVVVQIKENSGIVVDSSGVAADIGTGLKFGTTVGVAGKIVINDAEVSEVLLDERPVEGSTATISPVADRVVTPGNLRGALSVGQAVDVSCVPKFYWENISTDGGSTWKATTPALMEAAYLTEFQFKATAALTTDKKAIGWWTGAYTFQKFADGLVYLYIIDAKNLGDAIGGFGWGKGGAYQPGDFARLIVNTIYPDGTFDEWNESDAFGRLALVTNTDSMQLKAYAAADNSNLRIAVRNFRQYEVTALTDDAIEYLATLPNPDDFFRSADAYSIRNKYLVKQDMVCPFIPTINMDDDSDLTIAAGLSYKIKYMDDTKPHNVSVDTIPSLAYGWDAHVQMFVKGASAVNFKPPLVLMNQLTSNAGHNLSVKFRNGQAFVYVDDYDAGYVITVASGTVDGTLYAAITGATHDYAIFSAELDNTTVNGGTTTFVGDSKHTAMNIYGNGIDSTFITGNFTADTDRTINMQELTITGATLNGAYTFVDVGFDGIIDATNTAVFTITDGAITSGSTLKATACNITGLDLKGTLDISSSVGFLRGGYVTGPGTITGDATAIRFWDTEVTGCTISDMSKNGTWLSLLGGTYKDCLITNLEFVGARVCIPIDETILIDGSTFTNCKTVDGTATYGLAFNSSKCVATFRNMTYGMDTFAFTAGAPYPVVEGTLKFVDNGNFSRNVVIFSDNVILDCSQSTWPGSIPLISLPGIVVPVVFGNNMTIKIPNVADAKLDSCNTGAVYSFAGVGMIIMGCPQQTDYINVTGNNAVWNCVNLLINSPINAMPVDTVYLSGISFRSDGRTVNTNRIQLPASTTINMRGSTIGATAKVLDAGLIVVGNSPTAPSGTATIQYGVSGSTTVSGLGTYFKNNGEHDFVANTAANVYSVETETADYTAAKSLGAGLTSASPFIKISGNWTSQSVVYGTTVGNASYAADTTITYKSIISHTYEPIIRGSWLQAANANLAINESLGTATISSGNITVSDLYIGKNATFTVGVGGLLALADAGSSLSGTGTLNVGGAAIRTTANTGHVHTINGLTITGGNSDTDANGFCVLNIQGATVSCTDVTFEGNQTNDQYWKYVARCTLNSIGNFTRCTWKNNVFTDGTVVAGAAPLTAVGANSQVNVTDCNFLDTGRLYVSSVMNFSGTNKLLGSISVEGTLNLLTNSTLDLTDNTATTTPVFYGGSGVIVCGSYVKVLYNYDDNGSKIATVTATISGGSLSRIQRNGVLGMPARLIDTTMSIENASVASRSDQPYTALEDSTLSLKNCTILNTIYMYSGWGTGTLNLSGTIVQYGVYSGTGNPPDTNDKVVLADNTILKAAASSLTTLGYAHTVQVGRNCRTVDANNVSHYINGGTAGTFTNVYIKPDGTLSGTM